MKVNFKYEKKVLAISTIIIHKNSSKYCTFSNKQIRLRTKNYFIYKQNVFQNCVKLCSRNDNSSECSLGLCYFLQLDLWNYHRTRLKRKSNVIIEEFLMVAFFMQIYGPSQLIDIRNGYMNFVVFIPIFIINFFSLLGFTKLKV